MKYRARQLGAGLVALLCAGCGGASGAEAEAKAGSRPPPEAPAAESSESSVADGNHAPVLGSVADGKHALVLGDPVMALQILAGVSATNDEYAYAQYLIDDAKADIETIYNDWLAEIDTLITLNKFRAARARCKYMLDYFPLDEVSRLVIEEKAKRVEDQAVQARTELAAMDKQVRYLLLTDDTNGALQLMRDARDLAWEFDDNEALRWERTAAATELRFSAAVTGELIDASDLDVNVLAPEPRKKGNSGDEIKGPSVRDWERAKIEQRLQHLLGMGRTALARNSYYRAIVSYEQILKLAPGNKEAQAALESLAPRRKELIEKYLEKANECFLRQDLLAAKPYYDKVLLLQPGHKRATERIKMYENLEEIRSKSQ